MAGPPVKYLPGVAAALAAIAISSCMPAKQSASSLKVEDTQGSRPKLVLQITVDQLRGDLPTRNYDRLSDNGIRYLWENEEFLNSINITR